MYPRNLATLGITLALSLSSVAASQIGVAWPEADQLFHSDSRWLGADGAYSIDLGNGRVLWTFSDSFVSGRPNADRPHSAFLHNTVAIQSGYDPSQATIKFYWRNKRGKPGEIFPNEGKVWMWPGSGIRVGNRLLLFCERVAADHAKNSLGFKSVGWNAYWVMNPDDEPSAWKMKAAAKVNDTLILTPQALRDDRFVYLFAMNDNLYLARLRIESFAQGKLCPMQWWTGNDWQTAQSSRRPILRDAGTEPSIQSNPNGTGFIEVTSEGFGAADLILRRAQHLEGPWSAPQKIYRPPESDAPDAFVYAGKSHAELTGANLILTYVANGFDKSVAHDMTRYFPRFVKVELHGLEQSH